MTSRDFCYWLQGYFEILGAGSERDANEGRLSSGQVECIRRHLAMVFIHEIDPSHGPKAHQDALTAAHQGGGGAAQPPKQAGLIQDLTGLLVTDADSETAKLNC